MKRLITLLSLVILVQFAFGQLTGTKNIPGDYADLAAAITDLNTQGVGAGGVTLNLVAGNPQSAPAGGYVVGGTGSLVLTTTSVSNQVIIQGNGNTITASSALTAGLLNDAIFKIIGADWITITGFTMTENAANTTTTAASNNMTEWGVALLYVTTTDGAQNNTISSNTIDLNRTYQNTFGIYSNSTHTATNVTTSATATTTAGGNSGLVISGNSITDVNNGIIVVGPTAAADNNEGLTVGSSGNGNNITNYGTTGTFSGYANVSGTVNGILVRNTRNFTIAYNTVTSSVGGVTAGTLNGIHIPAFSNTPTGAFTNSINYNSISLKSGLIAGAMNGITAPSGSASTTSTININNNDFNNFGHTVAGTAAITFIIQSSTHQNQNINNNTFTNISVNTTGSVTFISNSVTIPTGGTQNVNNNSIVTGFSKTGAGGTVTIFTTNASSVAGTVVNNNNNNFSNITVTGATTILGWSNTDGGSPTKTIQGNTFTYWTGGTNTMTGMAVSFSSPGNVYGNTISNLTSAGAIIGITTGSTTQNIYQNTIHTLTTTGASAVTGIAVTGGTTNSVYKNSIYNLESNNASGTVNGILISSGTTVYAYNNFISNLRAPIANAAYPVVGINVSGGTTVNVFYNSVYLNASSSGALFGSAALYASTTPTLDMRNNVLVNVSTPNGAGVTAAYRRSTSTLTSYSANSNANCYYAGNPEDATHAVFYDGTTPQTMAGFQTLVGPTRDAISFRELPPFLNVSSTPYDLHLNTTIPTLCESGGLAVSSPITISDDYDGNTRGGNPDVGADEFNGIAGGVINPGNFTASVMSTTQINLGFALNPSHDNVVIVWNSTGTFTTPSGTPTIGGSLAGGTVLSNDITSPVSHTGLTYNTAYFYKAFSYTGSSYSSGVTANATTVLAPPTAFTATPFSSSQINLAYTRNAAPNDVIIATNSTATFDTPVNGTTYAVGNVIGSNGTVIYQGPLSAFSHTGLTSSTLYYYKVWSVDASSYYSATGATANATTPCDAISTFPWNEGFEGLVTVGTNILPACWTYTNITSSNYSCNGTCNSNTAHTGTKFIGGSWSFDVWDFTPGMQLAAGTSYDFSYWFKCTDAVVGYNVSLAYGTSPAAGSMTNVLNTETGLNISTWTFRTFTFTPASSGIYYFGLHNVCPTSAPNGIAFDDFKLEVTPSCTAPTALNATSITNNSATIGWTAASPAPSSGYDIYYSTSSTAPDGSTTPTGSVGAGVTTFPTGAVLTSNTPYYVWVRSNCGSGLYSPWAGYIMFTTLCDPYSSLNENFDAVTAPALPGCWAKYISPSYSFETVITYATAPYSSPNCVQIYSSGATLAADAPMLITPVLSNINAGTHQIRFYAKGASTNLSVIVGTMTDPANSATFTPFQTVTGLNTSTFTEKTVSFATYTGTDTYIAFRHPLTTTYNYIYIDNVVWEPAPTTPIFSITPVSKDFMLAIAGGTPTAAQTFTISNTGVGTLTIASGGISLTGADASHFTLTDANTYPINLTNGQTATVTVAFAPTTEGAKSANLQVVHNADGSPSATVLTGTGLPAGSLFESFEGTTFPPAGWSVDASTWTQSTSTAFHGTKSAYYYPTSTVTDKKLITPKVTIASGNTLKYYAKTGSGTGQTIQVRCSPDKSIWTDIGSPVTLTTTFTEYTVDLTSLAGHDYYLAFAATTTSSYVSFYVDYVSGPFVTQEAPGCAAIGLPANNGTGVSVNTTLTWTDSGTGGIPTGYYLYFGTDGSGITPPTNIENGTVKTSPYTPAAPLAYNTTYYWQVVPYNLLGSATGCSIWRFTTGGPTCDQTASASGYDDDPTTVTISSFPCTGGGTITGMTLDGTIGSNCPSWYTYNIIVNGTPVATSQCSQTGYNLNSYLPITSVALQSVDMDAYSDAVNLTLTLHISYTPPACPIPINLTVNGLSTTGANLAWTPGGTESAWEYVYGESPLAEPTGAGTATSSNTVNPIGSLTANTEYQYYVRANCGSSYSLWAGPYTFTTPCPATTLPYSENFDAVTAPAVPNCMMVTDDNSDLVKWVTSVSAPNSAPNSMRIGYNASLAMDDWFFTPPVALAVGTYKVSFWYKSSGSYPEAMEVKWGSAPNAAGMTNGPIFDDNNITTGTYTEGIGYMTVTSAGDYYIGWHGYSDADMWYLVVDDINISQLFAHDVAAISIGLNEVVPAGTLSPKAIVKNEGLNTETFDVTLTIGTYTSTQNVVALASGLSLEVTFAPWTAAVGNYTATLTTSLSGDENAGNNSINQAVKVMIINKEVYGYNAFANTGTDPEGPTQFNLASPGVLNSIADQSTINFVSGGTWANGIWYGNVSTDNTFISIDPVTGARTVIGSLGVAIYGISFNLIDGIMYGIDDLSLYTISMTSGLATLVGTNTGIAMVNLAINDAGVAYTIDIDNDVLGTINLNTGVFTPIGPIGFDANYAQDMEFDRESGELYVAAHDNTSGWLAWADKTTGNTLKIGDFEGGAEITGFAIPYCIGANTWTGTISNNWNDPRNWTCGFVPDQSVNVFIPSTPSGAFGFPVIATGISATCYDITVEAPATLTIQTGGTLTVINQ